MGTTVLIVDDEPEIRGLIAEEFGLRGYNALQASGCEEALSLLKNNHVDVLISDVRMPDGDGFELVRRIRNSGGRRLPVVLMSGLVHLEKSSLLELGVDDFIEKPFRFDELVDRVAANYGAPQVN